MTYRPPQVPRRRVSRFAAAKPRTWLDRLAEQCDEPIPLFEIGEEGVRQPAADNAEAGA